MDGDNNWDNADNLDWQNARSTRPISRGSRASRTSSVNTRDGSISEDELFHDTLENFNIHGTTETTESANFRMNEYIGETDPMMSGNQNFDNLPSSSNLFDNLNLDMYLDDIRIGQDMPDDHPLMRTLTQGDQDAREDRAGPSTQHPPTTSSVGQKNSLPSDLEYLRTSRLYPRDGNVIDYNTYLPADAQTTCGGQPDFKSIQLPFEFGPDEEVKQSFATVPRYSVDSESSHDHSRPSSVNSQYSENSWASRKRSMSTVDTAGDGSGTKRGRPPKYCPKGLPAEAVATTHEDPKKVLDRERNNQAVKNSRENSKKQQIRLFTAFNDIVTNYEHVRRNAHHYSRESLQVVCQIFAGLNKDDIKRLRESLAKLESPNKKSKKGDQPGPSSGP